ncbi:MAG: IclR family transcriptional regulator [Microbacteriaceae bacterium]
MSNEKSEVTGAQSVDRAVTVLEIIARRGDASVSEVAVELGVHRSTVSRLLAVLRLRGVVDLAGGRGRYRLGPTVLRLAGAIRSKLDVTMQGAEVCGDLAARLGETVNIAILQDATAVNIYQADGKGAVTVNNWVGRSTPLHATSSGKILLAWQPEAVTNSMLDERLTAFTPDTITDPVALAGQLARATADGFAVTRGELEVGLSAIAAPIRGIGGSVIAALSASGPSYRMRPELTREHAADVMLAAAKISNRMGYLG